MIFKPERSTGYAHQELRLAWSVFYADTKSFLENPVKIGKKLQAFANREEQVSPGVFLTLRRTGTKGNKAHYIMEKRVCQVLPTGYASVMENEDDDAYLLRRIEEREYA